MNSIVKRIAALAAAFAIPASLGVAFSGCEDNTNVNEKPIEEPVVNEEELIYKNDGLFNNEGFVRTFNEILLSDMSDSPETYGHYLNSFYDKYIPFYLYFNNETKEIKFASFATYREVITGGDGFPWSGEFRLVSFPIDFDDCKTWSEFKDKFLKEINSFNISYDYFYRYDHFWGESENLEYPKLDDKVCSLSNELYNKIHDDLGYEDEIYSDDALTFFGNQYEINDGRRMLVPTYTLYLDEETNEIKIVGSEIWVETEGGWENNILNETNLNVYSGIDKIQTVGIKNDTFCDLTSEEYQLQLEGENENASSYVAPSGIKLEANNGNFANTYDKSANANEEHVR